MSSAALRVVAAHAAASLALSLPWPLVLVVVAEHTRDPVLLGLAGAARMLPYVACSWFAGRLADVVRRDLVVGLTLLARWLLLLGGAVALTRHSVWPAVCLLTLAVAVSTPAYPALVAALPALTSERRRATDLLVTAEVAAFVVGAAAGGLLLRPSTRFVIAWLPLVLVAVAAALVAPVRMPRPQRTAAAAGVSAYAALRAAPCARRAVVVMAVTNLAGGALAIVLLPLALGRWGSDAAGYGLATGVLGFAGLAAPLARLGPPRRAMVRGPALVAVGVLALAATASLGAALLPLAAVGAAAVAVEAAATGVLRDELPDEVTATVLGLADAVIVGAAMLGALLAPPAVALAGTTPVLVILAVAVLVAVAPVSTVGGSREEDRAPQTHRDTAAVPAAVPAPRGERVRRPERPGQHRSHAGEHTREPVVRDGLAVPTGPPVRRAG